MLFRSLSVTRQEDGSILVTRPDDERRSRSLHGLSRSLINNMVVGVTQGYEKKLEIVGTGYRVAAKGQAIELSLGFSHTVVVEPPEGITFTVDGNLKITVSGISKEQVGEVAANIRKIRPPEPYKGKGVLMIAGLSVCRASELMHSSASSAPFQLRTMIARLFFVIDILYNGTRNYETIECIQKRKSDSFARACSDGLQAALPRFNSWIFMVCY